MAIWRENQHSFWIRGAVFDTWADQNSVPITDGPPEFVWVDIETTGLDADRDVTLELGIILTDGIGNVCRDAVIDWKVWAAEPIRTKNWEESFTAMTPMVKDMHKASGLTAELRSALSAPFSEHMEPSLVSYHAYEWLLQMVPDDRRLQLSGSTPHFDRSFLKRDLPALEDWFHYRVGVDVSGIREVAKRINPAIIASQPQKKEKHRPIVDLMDSLKLYRHFLATGFLAMDQETKVKFG